MSFTPLLPNNSHFSKTFPGLRSRARSPARRSWTSAHARFLVHAQRREADHRSQAARPPQPPPPPRSPAPSLPQLHWGPRFFGRSSCSLIGATFLRQFLHASRGICFLRFEAFCEMSLSKKSKILPSVRPSVPLFFKEKAAEGTRKETRDRPERVKRARAPLPHFQAEDRGARAARAHAFLSPSLFPR